MAAALVFSVELLTVPAPWRDWVDIEAKAVHMLASHHKLQNPSSLTLGHCTWIMEKGSGKSSHSKWTVHLVPYTGYCLSYQKWSESKGKGCVGAIMGFCLCDHREGIRKRGVAAVWASRLKVSELRGIAVFKKHTFRKVTPPAAAEALMSFPLLTLKKEVQVCSYRNQVMNALIGDRGALSPARQRKGAASLNGLYGTEFLAHQTHGRALVDTGAQWNLMPSGSMEEEHSWISGVTGAPSWWSHPNRKQRVTVCFHAEGNPLPGLPVPQIEVECSIWKW